jgi:hypothetical protein
MDDTKVYQLLADIVLAMHLAVVTFVVVGLAVVIAGNLRGWRGVNAGWFRLAHLGAIVFVAAESWFGVVCPLTSLEMWLRAKARVSVYAGSFVEHWIQRVLYYNAPAWVFTAIYTVFGMLVVAAWWYYPPRFRRRADKTSL